MIPDARGFAKTRHLIGKENAMKLDTKAMALTSGLFWGGAVLTVGLVNLAKPPYGESFLRMIGSIYPGYDPKPDPKQVAIGTSYALLDGAIGGAIFAVLYNMMDGKKA